MTLAVSHVVYHLERIERRQFLGCYSNILLSGFQLSKKRPFKTEHLHKVVLPNHILEEIIVVFINYMQ